MYLSTVDNRVVVQMVNGELSDVIAISNTNSDNMPFAIWTLYKWQMA